MRSQWSGPNLVVLALIVQFGRPISADPAADSDLEIVNESIEISISSDGTAYESGARSVAILTEAGVANASFTLPVHPFTSYTNVRGRLVKPDGEEIEVKPAQIVERPQVDSSALVRETSLLQVSYPGAQVGSVMHLTWNRRLQAAMYAQPWVFRGTLPIRRSQFKVRAPRDYALRFKVWNGSIEPTVTSDADGTLYAFEIANTKPTASEPFAPEPYLTLGMVELYLPEIRYDTVALRLKNWGDVATFYEQLSSGQYELSPEVIQEIERDVKVLPDERERIARLYGTLQKYRYLQVYLGAGGYRPHAAMWTHRRKFGDCKDLSTLLVSMLRVAGVNAYPMLTRLGRGRPTEDSFPSLQEFNHCVTYVPRKDGAIILDATAPSFPVGQLPSALGGAPGLVVYGRGKHERITLPEAEAEKNQIVADLTLGLDSRQGLRGALSAALTGDFLAFGRSLAARGTSELVAGSSRFLLPVARPVARLEGIQFEDTAQVLTVRGNYVVPFAVVHDGDSVYVSPSVAILDPRTSAFSSESRQSPVDLGQVDQIDLRLRFQGHAITPCTPPVDLDTDFGSYHLSCSATPTEVVFTRRLRVTQTWIEPREYQAARTFWHTVATGDQSAVELTRGPQ